MLISGLNNRARYTETMHGAMELLQQFVDVLAGTFHRRQAAGVLARKRFVSRRLVCVTGLVDPR